MTSQHPYGRGALETTPRGHLPSVIELSPQTREADSWATRTAPVLYCLRHFK